MLARTFGRSSGTGAAISMNPRENTSFAGASGCPTRIGIRGLPFVASPISRTTVPPPLNYRNRPRLTRGRLKATVLAATLLAGCSYQNNASLAGPPGPSQDTPVATGPVESTSGTLTLQQFDLGSPANAVVSTNDQFTLIPDGAPQ